MGTRSNILAWRIPRIEEPGALYSPWGVKVRHDWSDLACMHQCLRLCAPNTQSPGFDTWLGNLIPHVATKIQNSQINKYFLKTVKKWVKRYLCPSGYKLKERVHSSPHPLFVFVTVTSKVPDSGCSIVLGLREKQDKSKNSIHPPAVKQPEHSTLFSGSDSWGVFVIATLPSAHPF